MSVIISRRNAPARNLSHKPGEEGRLVWSHANGRGWPGAVNEIRVFAEESARQVENLPEIRICIGSTSFSSRAAGADAILLIAECLEDGPLADLHALALELGMSALVELYEPQNLPRVLAISPALVGVNNRDLKTMTVRLEHSLDLRPRVPPGMVFVAESGIKTRADIELLERGGVNAFLIGETLMRADDRAGKLRELMNT